MSQMKMGFILFALTVSMIFYHPAGAQNKVPNSVFGNGGREILSSGNRIVSTVGQPIIGWVNSPAYNNKLGFWYQSGGFVTGIGLLSNGLPTEYLLEQNYPNPFNPETVIEYQLPRPADVEISIFNLWGQRVVTLVAGRQTAGTYKIIWDGKDEAGRSVASGVYFYQMKCGDFKQTQGMSLVK